MLVFRPGGQMPAPAILILYPGLEFCSRGVILLLELAEWMGTDTITDTRTLQQNASLC